MLTPTFITATLLALSGLTVAQKPTYLSPVVIRPRLNYKKCIQPVGGSSAAGTAVVISDCTGATSQEFFFESNRIRVFSNQCLTVPNGNTTNGVQLRLAACNANDNNQKFYYNFWNNQISLLNNRGKCVDLNGGSTANGAAIQIWACSSGNPNQVFYTGYEASDLPAHSQNGQVGTNNCGTGSSASSVCQTSWINSVDDFCLWGPRSVGSIGNLEREVVSYCTKSGRGTRVMPAGTLKGVHFVKTDHYVQITGTGDFTKINIQRGDAGGELDPHGPDGNGNPIGGLLYSNVFGQNMQMHEWTSFIGASEFCIRACIGKDALRLCNHIYDVMGCWWNIPGSYDSGIFESCDGDETQPMGVYGTSTWHQGVSPTPSAHPAAPSSNCKRVATVGPGTLPSTSATTTVTTTTTTTGTTTTPPAPTGLTVRPKASSAKCLNAVSNTDGANVTVQDCNSGANQKWTRTGNTFRVFGTKCLDVREGVNNNGTKLQIWDCGPGNYGNQQWTTNAAGQITWSGKNKCVDLTDGKTTNGQQIQIWQCATGNNNQVWNIA